jgi:hypothetical protein
VARRAGADRRERPPASKLVAWVLSIAVAIAISLGWSRACACDRLVWLGDDERKRGLVAGRRGTTELDDDACESFPLCDFVFLEDPFDPRLHCKAVPNGADSEVLEMLLVVALETSLWHQ